MKMKFKTVSVAALCWLVLYGILLLGVTATYRGWLPGADQLLSGRSIHPLSMYLAHFTRLFLLGTVALIVFMVLLWGLIAWVKSVGGWRKFLPRMTFMVLFTLFLAEIVLRMAFSLPGGRIPGLQNAELLGDPNADNFYWVLAARVSTEEIRDHVHPMRGWSQKRVTDDNPHGLRPDAQEAIAAGGPIIHLFGDSFVHGMPFNEKTLPEMITEKNADRTPVNLGVRGYGVDQMYLMSQELGLPSEKGEVWVGILTWDLDRAYLDFNYGQKPRYLIEGDELVLTNIPIEQPDEEYIKAYRMPFRSWVVQAIRRQWQQRQGLERGGPERDQKIAVNRLILRDWSSWCRDAGITMKVILFHTRQDLATDSWRNRAVKAYCEEFDLPLFDTADVLLPYLEEVGSWGQELYEEGDFHHTDLANALIADWLAEHWVSDGGDGQ